MKPKSHTLFHFTKSQDSLKKILTEGFWPRLCLEDIRWYNAEQEFLALPIVCFCDIPLSRIDEHVNFYGDYGLGLSKDWAVRNGLNPVMYVSKSSIVASAIKRLSWAQKQYPDDEQDEVKRNFISILSHTKPIEGKMTIGNDILTKEFYQENEWRFFAKHEDFSPWLKKEDFEEEEQRNEYNNITKELCSLIVLPQDIKYIFVKSDSNIPDIINFIQTELDNFSGVDQKILMSRVISLESIRHDL